MFTVYRFTYCITKRAKGEKEPSRLPISIKIFMKAQKERKNRKIDFSGLKFLLLDRLSNAVEQLFFVR